MDFERITEKDSNYNNLEVKSIPELLENIHAEDLFAVKAVSKSLTQIKDLISNLEGKLKNNGRLFYIGAGTSGRLGVLDASECPPTFGTDPEKVVGVIAGGNPALSKSIENAEDDHSQGWEDLKNYNVNSGDFVIGITASGTTTYVVEALKKCGENNISTGCITSNPNSPVANHSNFPIEINVGPEFLTGSSRMKSGTAQKLILNMITTVSMIRLGKVRGNKMIDMQLTNKKLNERAVKIIMDELGVDKKFASDLLLKHKSVREVLNKF